MSTKPSTQGDILVLTIIFTSVFSILFASLIRYLVTQYISVSIHTAQDEALQIAEAGVEYYRWHLAHFPNDLQDGTGAVGPYVHAFEDPETGIIGYFSLEIGGEVLCGQTQVVHATSTAWTIAKPEVKKTIFVRIARPTVADFSYIVDSNVYAGATRIITGPYHSNGAVRMDADNRSAVTSKMATTSCVAAGLGGCTDTINGVYGEGSHPEWWRNAEPDIPFSNFDFDFGQIQAIAQASGIFLDHMSNDVNNYGYYLKLKNNKTVDIYKVKAKWANVNITTPGSEALIVPELANANITGTYLQFLQNKPIPEACPLIYVSDRTWLEGVVSGKVTVVANDVGVASPDVFLQNNITYNTNTGTDGLTVLAERNILIPLYVPDNMTLSGIFLAQKGSYGRPWYNLAAPYNAFRTRNMLTTTGTVVSKLRTGTSWTDGTAFVNRTDNYDRNLVDAPPPLTPFTSSDFRLIEWREVK